MMWALKVGPGKGEGDTGAKSKEKNQSRKTEVNKLQSKPPRCKPDIFTQEQFRYPRIYTHAPIIVIRPFVDVPRITLLHAFPRTGPLCESRHDRLVRHPLKNVPAV